MKKFSLFIILCIFILSISTPQKTYALNIKDIYGEQIAVKLLDEKNNPIPNTYVTLYSLSDGIFLDHGYTDQYGVINFIYSPKFTANNENVIDVDLGVYAAPKNAELVPYYFTQTFIKDQSLYSNDEIKELLHNNSSSIEITAKNEINTLSMKMDIRSVKIRNYLVQTGKLSPEKPIHKLNSADSQDMLLKGILTSEELSLGKNDAVNIAGNNTLLADVTHNLGNFLTTVGEVHSINGLTSTFKLATQSGVNINVSTSVGGGIWTASGSLSKKTEITTTWPAFSTTSTSGYGKEAKAYIEYKMDETMSYWSGNITYSVYPSRYIGGTAWGSSIYGKDGASPSSINSGSLGSDNFSYRAGSEESRTLTSGRTFSVAARISIPKLSATISAGASTSYTSATTITFKCAYSPHTTYYIYGRGSNYKTLYVSNSSR